MVDDAIIVVEALVVGFLNPSSPDGYRCGDDSLKLVQVEAVVAQLANDPKPDIDRPF